MDLLFDYDGTLHESLRIYHPAVQAVRDELAAEGRLSPRVVSAAEAETYIGMAPDEMWRLFAPSFTAEERSDAADRVGRHMARALAQGRARLYPGTRGVLEDLKAAGHRLFLLSMCPRSYMEEHLEIFQLTALFCEAMCGEDHGYRPKFEIVRQRMDRGDFHPVCIGDRFSDVEAGRKNGLPVVGCLYGYGSPEELRKCSVLIRDIAELPAALETIST
ncbi:MAG: HAD family hydrolase [Oscillospiraceae bacterium]|nr:HAD family hydrolase [Oscillospiraceae bacterium]